MLTQQTSSPRLCAPIGTLNPDSQIPFTSAQGARQIVQLQPLWKWLLLPMQWPRFWKNTPGHGRGVLVPSSLLRYLTFKVVADLPQIPAVSRLLFAIISKMVNGALQTFPTPW